MFDNAVAKVLIHEGGYVNDPHDLGGETNFGISKKAYPHLNIKNLTIDDAKEIYKRDFWDKLRCDEIANQKIAYEIFDTAVNMGVRTATKLIQMCLDVRPDGILGVKTLDAINSRNFEVLILKFKLAKISRYIYITQKRPANKKFFYGWIKRVMSC